MEFDKVVMERYAVKKFDGKKVPEEKVKKLLELIRYAPSSFNIQPWKIVIVTDDHVKQKLAPAAWNQPQITSCSHLLVFCANTDVSGNISKLEKARGPEGKASIEMMRGFEKGLSEQEKLSWAQRQLFLALANAVNGAKHLGFDSCPMEGFMPNDFAKILSLPSNIVPTALCPIGYAADTPETKFRFPESEVFLKR